jgi:glyoxylase-like metal-dependent hydrolase (beta-lactamase superfamily II)
VTPASPEGAWPVETFTGAVTFHWNGDVIRAYHVPPAHTDGDIVIRFERADFMKPDVWVGLVYDSLP